MKHIIKYLFIYLIFNNNVVAQSTSFFKTYLNISREDGGFRKIIQSPDKGYIAFGNFPETAPSNFPKSVLLKTDSNGDSLWSKFYTDYGYDITLASDSGYLMVGNYIIRVNSKGDTLWTRAYDVYYGNGFSVKQTNDKGFIICGVKKTDLGIYLPNVLKLDSSGNKQWDRIYNITNESAPYSVNETFDGNFIVGGDVGNGTSRGIFLLKINKVGDSLWSNFFYTKNAQFSCYDMKECKDRGYIICGNMLNVDNRDIYILKTDIDGNKQWDKTYGGKTEDRANSIIETKDGNYMLTGRIDYTSNFSTIWKYGDAFLLKIGTNGDSVYMKRYGRGMADEGTHLIEGINGSHILVGNTYNGTTGNHEGMIIKIDSNGNAPNLITAIQNPNNGNFYTSSNSDNGNFTFFPNPTYSGINIQFNIKEKEQLSIYNMWGEMVYKDNISLGQPNTYIDFAAFSQGLYIIRVGEAVQKVMKE